MDHDGPYLPYPEIGTQRLGQAPEILAATHALDASCPACQTPSRSTAPAAAPRVVVRVWHSDVYRPRGKAMADNKLYYGDNLDVLRRHIPDESVDLVYLDPPFNSNADYNVLFGRREGQPAPAQIQAFEDTWRWDQSAAAAYAETVEAGGDVSRALQSFRTLLGESDMLAYVCMMAPRLVALRRVLKETGSIYLHCDPTASHYLKLLMDSVFGPSNFRNEITWKRRVGMSSAVHESTRFGSITDTLLFYAKSDDTEFRPQYNLDSPLCQRT